MTVIRLTLLGTVFTTGAAVLIMEVAAVRFFTPYFGSSLYVLSSVLTVILLALSLGYYYGGKLSDRFPFHMPLYFIIGSGGISLFLLSSVATKLLPATGNSLPMLSGPLVFSVIFFFLPAFLLGIDSPYVIKLLSKSIEKESSGGVVGATFFWSTAGSITGSLASGFFLIPFFGLIETILGTSLVLIVLGVAGGIFVRFKWRKLPDYDTRNDVDLSLPIIVAAIITSLLLYTLGAQQTNGSVLYKSDGYYSSISIFDGNYKGQKVRYMKRDINNSSAISLENDDLVYEYSLFAPLYKELVPEAKSFLMLGGGAYTIPKAIHNIDQNIVIDVVELEPSLFELAHEYFRLPYTERIRNHVVDARVFIKNSKQKYDVMFLDVFNSGFYIPPHLVTKEHFDELRAKLTDNGVMMINIISTLQKPDEQTLIGSFSKTLLEVFPNTVMYTLGPNYPEYQQNIVFVSRPVGHSVELPETYVIDSVPAPYTLKELKLDPKDYISKHDKTLTDNHNPVEILVVEDQIRSRQF